MKLLLITRKKPTDIGGLSRFSQELSSQLSPVTLVLTPPNIYKLLSLPFQNIDLIYLCDASLLPFGIIYKLMLRKPLVLTAHGLDLTYPNLIYQFLLKRLIPFADSIVFNSNAAMQLLKEFDLPQTKTSVIHPGVTIAQFQEEETFSYPHPNHTIALLTIGNLVKRKGHVWFIRNVLPKLPERYIYYIVGGGPQKKEILKAIRSQHLSGRVFLLGRITDAQLSYVFKHTDIYVSPNQKEPHNFESFGIANGEAAALGIPVVASDVDGISELIINGKNGILGPPLPERFVDAIKKLEDKNLRRILGQKAKAYTLKNYTWNKTVEAYRQVFQIILQQREKA